ncbi:hypothetical protein ABBQ32_002028 [Trebouxia sp. C0010 RCD-2024]
MTQASSMTTVALFALQVQQCRRRPSPCLACAVQSLLVKPCMKSLHLVSMHLQLQVLDLSSNQLVGSLPDSHSHLMYVLPMPPADFDSACPILLVYGLLSQSGGRLCRMLPKSHRTLKDLVSKFELDQQPSDMA